MRSNRLLLWAMLLATAVAVAAFAGEANESGRSEDTQVASKGAACATTASSTCAAPGAKVASSGAACSSHGAGCSSSCSTRSGFTSRCAEYGACSLYGDLTGAKGDVLDMYVKERARDGETYDDLELPEFTAVALDGKEISSVDLRGQPTVLVTLAGHCTHSFQTLPILADLEEKFGPKGVQVVGIFLNSGNAEDVAAFMKSYDPEYKVLASPTDEIGDTIDSHLVPTYLLVDEHGQVKQRLVGYQEKQLVESSLATHFDLAAVDRSASDSSGR